MTTEPIRDRALIGELAGYWLKRGCGEDGANIRNYTLIVLGVCTALRIGDLLRLTWEDVYDFERGRFRQHVSLTEKKTGKHKTVALNAHALEALRLYFPHRRGAFVFAGNRKDGRPVSRVQAWRVIRASAEAINATEHIACHSLRKTFGYFAWKSGVPPVMLMDIFNHSSFDITRRYLGITQEDRDKIYTDISLF